MSTLNDLQKLLRTINWVCPSLDVTIEQLDPLFRLPKGDHELTSTCTLTPRATEALEQITQMLSAQQAHKKVGGIPVNLYTLLTQWDDAQKDPLVILEWIFLPHQFGKNIVSHIELISLSIQRGRQRLLQLDGADPSVIYLPVTRDYLDWLQQHSLAFQVALQGFSGQLNIHMPAHTLLNSSSQLNFIEKSYCSPIPIANACRVFTDGSGKTGRSLIVWQSNRQWLQDVEVVHGSSQPVELAAVVRASEKFQDELNIVTDSAYVAGIVTRIEEAYIKEVTNPLLFSLLLCLHFAVQLHMKRYYILHVCSHTSLPGPISEGNAHADQLAGAVDVPDVLRHVCHMGFFTRVQQLFENNSSLHSGKHGKLCKPVPAVNR